MRRLILVLSWWAMAAAVTSCGSKSTQPCTTCPPPSPYMPASSPENQLVNFQTVFNRREPAHMDSVLAQGFVFRFLQSDIQQGYPDSTTRGSMMTFWWNFLVTGAPGIQPAAQVEMAVLTQSYAGDDRNGHSGWQRYIVSTQLQVRLADGKTLSVQSPAWLYLKQEPAGSGRWVLAEWVDQPGSFKPARPLGTQVTTNSRVLTWGELIQLYK